MLLKGSNIKLITLGVGEITDSLSNAVRVGYSVTNPQFPMRSLWTYGPTLMPWRYHLHTAHHLFLNLSKLIFKFVFNFKINFERFLNKRRAVCRWFLYGISVGPYVHCWFIGRRPKGVSLHIRMCIHARSQIRGETSIFSIPSMVPG